MRELFPCVPYPMVKPRVSCFTVLNLMCNMWTVNESFAGSLHGGFLGVFLGASCELLEGFLDASWVLPGRFLGVSCRNSC